MCASPLPHPKIQAAASTLYVDASRHEDLPAAMSTPMFGSQHALFFDLLATGGGMVDASFLPATCSTVSLQASGHAPMTQRLWRVAHDMHAARQAYLWMSTPASTRPSIVDVVGQAALLTPLDSMAASTTARLARLAMWLRAPLAMVGEASGMVVAVATGLVRWAMITNGRLRESRSLQGELESGEVDAWMHPVRHVAPHTITQPSAIIALAGAIVALARLNSPLAGIVVRMAAKFVQPMAPASYVDVCGEDAATALRVLAAAAASVSQPQPQRQHQNARSAPSPRHSAPPSPSSRLHVPSTFSTQPPPVSGHDGASPSASTAVAVAPSDGQRRVPPPTPPESGTPVGHPPTQQRRVLPPTTTRRVIADLALAAACLTALHAATVDAAEELKSSARHYAHSSAAHKDAGLLHPSAAASPFLSSPPAPSRDTRHDTPTDGGHGGDRKGRDGGGGDDLPGNWDAEDLRTTGEVVLSLPKPCLRALFHAPDVRERVTTMLDLAIAFMRATTDADVQATALWLLRLVQVLWESPAVPVRRTLRPGFAAPLRLQPDVRSDEQPPADTADTADDVGVVVGVAAAAGTGVGADVGAVGAMGADMEGVGAVPSATTTAKPPGAVVHPKSPNPPTAPRTAPPQDPSSPSPSPSPSSSHRRRTRSDAGPDRSDGVPEDPPEDTAEADTASCAAPSLGAHDALLDADFVRVVVAFAVTSIASTHHAVVPPISAGHQPPVTAFALAVQGVHALGQLVQHTYSYGAGLSGGRDGAGSGNAILHRMEEDLGRAAMHLQTALADAVTGARDRAQSAAQTLATRLVAGGAGDTDDDQSEDGDEGHVNTLLNTGDAMGGGGGGGGGGGRGGGRGAGASGTIGGVGGRGATSAVFGPSGVAQTALNSLSVASPLGRGMGPAMGVLSAAAAFSMGHDRVAHVPIDSVVDVVGVTAGLLPHYLTMSVLEALGFGQHASAPRSDPVVGAQAVGSSGVNTSAPDGKAAASAAPATATATATAAATATATATTTTTQTTRPGLVPFTDRMRRDELTVLGTLLELLCEHEETDFSTRHGSILQQLRHNAIGGAQPEPVGATVGVELVLVMLRVAGLAAAKGEVLNGVAEGERGGKAGERKAGEGGVARGIHVDEHGDSDGESHSGGAVTVWTALGTSAHFLDTRSAQSVRTHVLWSVLGVIGDPQVAEHLARYAPASCRFADDAASLADALCRQAFQTDNPFLHAVMPLLCFVMRDILGGREEPHSSDASAPDSSEGGVASSTAAPASAARNRRVAVWQHLLSRVLRECVESEPRSQVRAIMFLGGLIELSQTARTPPVSEALLAQIISMCVFFLPVCVCARVCVCCVCVLCPSTQVYSRCLPSCLGFGQLQGFWCVTVGTHCVTTRSGFSIPASICSPTHVHSACGSRDQARQGTGEGHVARPGPVHRHALATAPHTPDLGRTHFLGTHVHGRHIHPRHGSMLGRCHAPSQCEECRASIPVGRAAQLR